MKWRRVFYVWPVPVIEQQEDPGVGAQTAVAILFPYITVGTDYARDESRIQHELRHVRDMLMFLVLPYALLYGASLRFSRWVEGRAFKVQMRYPDQNGHYMTLEEAGAAMATKCEHLGMTPEEAVAYIRGL